MVEFIAGYISNSVIDACQMLELESSAVEKGEIMVKTSVARNFAYDIDQKEIVAVIDNYSEWKITNGHQITKNKN